MLLIASTYVHYHGDATCCSDSLRDVVQMLQNTNHPQVEYLTRVMRKWARENKVSL